jgi:membrane protease YdiL (CAAX protease family)
VIVVVAAGCALLVGRPLLRQLPHPALVLLALFVALLAAGAGWPARTGTRAAASRAGAVLAVGLAAFLVGRLVGGGHPPFPAAGHLIAFNSLAAVAEEAFFRRLAYAALLPGGPGLAVAGSATLFALVHVTVYGAWVLPIDLAAGLLFAWQRWATGSWLVPAATHAVANLLVVL